MSNNTSTIDGLPPPSAFNSSGYCYEARNASAELPNYTVPEFSDTDVIRRVHYNTPRFGHTRNIDALLFEDLQQGEDYLWGVFWCSIAIAIFVFLWLIVLIVLRCLGPERVGMFSGKRPHARAVHSDKDNDSKKEDSIQSKADDDVEEEVQVMVEGDEDNESKKGDSIQSKEDAAEEEVQKQKEGEGIFSEPRKEGNMQAEADNILEEGQVQVEEENAPTTPSSAFASASEQKDSFHNTEKEQEQESEEAKNVAVEDEPCKKTTCWKRIRDFLKKILCSGTPEKRLRDARIAVLLCGFASIVSVILLSALGIPHLRESVTATQDTLLQGENLAYEGVDVINAFLSRFNTTQQGVRAAVSSSDGICPLVVEAYCNESTSSTVDVCNSTVLVADLNDFRNATRKFIEKNFAGTTQDLEKTASDLNDMNQTLSSFIWVFPVAVVSAILHAFITIMVCYGVVLAWKRQDDEQHVCRLILNILRSCLLVPFFAFLTLLSFVFTLIFVIGSLVTADFCVDSPDSRVSGLIEEKEDRFSSSVFYFLTLYYVDGCPDGAAFQELEFAWDAILKIGQTVLDLANALEGLSPEEYQQVCGVQKSTFKSLAYSVEASTCLLAASMVDVRSYFSCGNWNPLYIKSVYDGVCYSGNRGLYYVCITQFMMVVFAMVMLTLRASFLAAPSAGSSETGLHGGSLNVEPDTPLTVVGENQDPQRSRGVDESPPEDGSLEC